MGRLWRAVGVAIVLLSGLPFSAAAQALRGVVVDQTGLPLPGATIELMDGTTVTAMIVSGPDGSFEIPATARGLTVIVKLQGFETVIVPRLEASRVMLPLARATATTEVVAPVLASESPVAPLFGTSLTAVDIARLPSSHLKAHESLPLLPSVVRGPDGLLRLGGARPSESPLLLDGFDVSDPATGISAINLPFEAVQGIEVLRDPMAITYGSLIGGLVKIESRTGGESRQLGVQGFIPRPRFKNPGFGRIEGVFPRFFVGGRAASPRVRYFGAVEYDFERISVPDVTQGSGPDIVEKSATVFGRIDIYATERNRVVIEGLVFPSGTDSSGLSPRRDEPAAPLVRTLDLFGGITHRMILNNSTLVTVRVGLLSHESRLVPSGSGPTRLSPSGWRDNWFAAITRRSMRYSLTTTLERTIGTRRGAHDVTAFGFFHAQRLRGTVAQAPVMVENDDGRLVRAVTFEQPSSLRAHDWPYGIAARDVWRANDRLQLDGGVRVDGRYGVTPSARIGVRYALTAAGLTVLKGGVGSFVGNVPLAVPAFSGHPARSDWRLDEATGREQTLRFHPNVDRVRLPRATAVTVQLEQQLRPGLDGQVGYTRRRSRRMATLDVPEAGGPLVVTSGGAGTYREIHVSLRQMWGSQHQVFVSYVHSSTRGELNDFMALSTGFDAPLLQPGGMSRLAADAPHRWIAWGTATLPHKVVFSPVMEWHSGFPYSVLDSRQFYAGEPNGARFPPFMAVDLITYKTVTYRSRTADLGVQLFNLTNHFNPRDVYPVKGARNYGTFTNSVGPIVRGFMMIKW